MPHYLGVSLVPQSYFMLLITVPIARYYQKKCLHIKVAENIIVDRTDYIMHNLGCSMF